MKYLIENMDPTWADAERRFRTLGIEVEENEIGHWLSIFVDGKPLITHIFASAFADALQKAIEESSGVALPESEDHAS